MLDLSDTDDICVSSESKPKPPPRSDSHGGSTKVNIRIKPMAQSWWLN
jgi:hypothetical protein